MNFLFVILPILLLVTTIPSSFSENSSVTEYGFFGVDQDTYTLAQGDEILVKISGIGEMPSGVERERANITITNPDSSADGHRVFSGNDGYFELLLPISYHSQVGVYKVFATFHGHVLGEVYFTVERMSINDADATSDSSNEEPEHVFAFRTSMFEVETDSLSYEKDSIIYISGAVPTQPKLDLTLQIIDPMNNIILINQITPNPDGTFEDSVNTNSPLWKFEGDYNIRINHNEQDLYSTFSFSIPTNEIVIPNPIESVQEPEVIVQEPVIQNPPPAITSPPPPQATIQESDEFNPSGLIVLAIIFFIIAIIIKKKRGKKSPAQTQSQTYPSMSRQSDSQAVLMQSTSGTPVASTPTKIDDIKVAIQKIDSLIRRNKNKIGECNEELTYYNGPRGGDRITKDAMIGHYESRINELKDLNKDLNEIRGYSEDENTIVSLDSLNLSISSQQTRIETNNSEIREFNKILDTEPSAPLAIEFYENQSEDLRTSIEFLKEIKQIIENSIKSGKSEKQLLINEYKSYTKKLEDSFKKVQKLINEQSSNWSQYEITVAKNSLNIYKDTVDSSVQDIHNFSNEDLIMLPKAELQKEIQRYKDMIKDAEDATENILSEREEAHTGLPKPDSNEQKLTSDHTDDIKKERRERLKKAHPDNGGSEEEFHKVMKEYEKPEKQSIMNEYRSYPTILVAHYEKLKKLIDDESSNWPKFVKTAALQNLSGYKEIVDDVIRQINSQSNEDLKILDSKGNLQESIQFFKKLMEDVENATKDFANTANEESANLPTPDPSKYTDNVDDKILKKYSLVFETITELKNDLLENRQYYEEKTSNSNVQKLLDVLDSFEKTITKNKDIYDMSKRLPDELSEDMRQRFLQELTSISDEPLKEISSSLKELKKKRKEESNSNESDGEDSESFDSELERRKKQVEEDYYAEKRAERENRDV